MVDSIDELGARGHLLAVFHGEWAIVVKVETPNNSSPVPPSSMVDSIDELGARGHLFAVLGGESAMDLISFLMSLLTLVVNLDILLRKSCLVELRIQMCYKGTGEMMT